MGNSRQSPPSPELKIFGNRLTRAIELKKMDISVLAKEFKCAPADIKKMMNGIREPTMKKLIIVANTLDCSTDYLLGLSTDGQCAAVVVPANTEAIEQKQSEHRQTSGQISGKVAQFLAVVSELLEADIDLLMHIASFLIERKGKGLARLVEAVTADAKKEAEKISPNRISIEKPKVPEFEEVLEDDFEDDYDDLWDDVEDDEFEDDEFEDDDFDEDDFD